MTGIVFSRSRLAAKLLSVAAVATLGACTENGSFAFPGAESAAPAAPLPANATNQTVQRGVDIERPDIFSISDSGLWDGRPSLGGVWVAHPQVTDPERVVIRNTESGKEIVGALFRREREIPGPSLQVSSDAAEALGLLPGAPTRLDVVVLRRADVMQEEPENPVVASLDAPVAVEASALEPANAAEPDTTGSLAGAAVAATAATVPAATQSVAAAGAAPANVVDVSSVLDTPAPLAEGTLAQVGVYSVEANANNAVRLIQDAGMQATVTPQELGGRTVWRVRAGPLTDARDVTRLKEMGFVDAFVVEGAQ